MFFTGTCTASRRNSFVFRLLHLNRWHRAAVGYAMAACSSYTTALGNC